MTFTQRRIEQVQIFTFVGSLTASQVAAARQQLQQLIQIQDAWVLIDLSQLNFIDAQGLSLLIFALRRCHQFQGELFLLKPSTMVRGLLELTRLQHSFIIYLDEHAALMHLKQLQQAVVHPSKSPC
jgi:anti-sigma B factor antagonist